MKGSAVNERVQALDFQGRGLWLGDRCPSFKDIARLIRSSQGVLGNAVRRLSAKATFRDGARYNEGIRESKGVRPLTGHGAMRRS
ncbi:hypothetical protein EDC27_2692 [Desulfosoma caldarium]|uniref:Uncharacterized protein n=1 Tax=Desulfosoma caldarium TaxID=610254 RepID=A0A3N1UM35_9BACT|nr:hypothetical protein EDC27_2692 [Desulfosoma caldarium]